jgi:hypothetical protein
LVNHCAPKIASLHTLLHALIILFLKSPQVKPVLLLANVGRRVEECNHERFAVSA